MPLWQSGNSHPLAVATRECARLVNVNRLAAFPCVSVKRSMDLNRRDFIGILQISFAHDNNVYFLTMVHKNQFTLN